MTLFGRRLADLDLNARLAELERITRTRRVCGPPYHQCAADPASGLPFEERPPEALVFVHRRHPTISEILWNVLERRSFRKSQR
jgi:hypothetical protein